MLQEVDGVRQNPGEPPRRWFEDDYFDLIIWQQPEGEISGFQLCYNKREDEHAFVWNARFGYLHTRVDDGEFGRLKKSSPMMTTDGGFDLTTVRKLFAENSDQIDDSIAGFVIQKLREYVERG